ncbi:hypothetical protein VitviT2T_020024 [Vitis vinifera]|nr:hypothetical protein VitviT2T_020024 [Vitis vinifera]
MAAKRLKELLETHKPSAHENSSITNGNETNGQSNEKSLQRRLELGFAKPTTRLKNLGKRSDFLAFCPILSFCLHFHGWFLESAVELRLPFGVIADIYRLFAKVKIPTFIDYLGIVVEALSVEI